MFDCLGSKVLLIVIGSPGPQPKMVQILYKYFFPPNIGSSSKHQFIRMSSSLDILRMLHFLAHGSQPTSPLANHTKKNLDMQFAQMDPKLFLAQ
jgi:ABC-type microcin C transport system permease subunit YejE